jgi:hypothetical protein
MQVRGSRYDSTDLLAGRYSSAHLVGGSVSFRVGLKILEKKFFALNGIQTPDRLAHRLVAIGYFRTDNKTKKQRDEIKC